MAGNDVAFMGRMPLSLMAIKKAGCGRLKVE
jgi:hypothetical protein